MSRMININETHAEALKRHLIIGHSQIRGCWNEVFDKEELNFPIDWMCLPGGKAYELMEIVKTEIRDAQIPTRISAIIWQNSVPNLSLEDVQNLLEDVEILLAGYPEHKVAFPECQFVPDQEKHFEHIGRINKLLQDYNQRNGFNRYPLFKSTMKSGGGLKVDQKRWSEFLKNQGKGYHIDNKHKYTQFIRKFHLHGFRDNKPCVAYEPSQINTDKLPKFCVLTPANKMKVPGDNQHEVFDLRQKLSRKRSGSSEETHSLGKKLRLEQEEFTTTDGSPGVPEPVDDPDSREILTVTIEPSDEEDNSAGKDLMDWFKAGKEQGYFKAMQKIIKEKRKSKKEYEKKKKEKKKDDKKRGKREKPSRKEQTRKKKKQRQRRDSSSTSTDSETSTTTSDSSESD